MGEAEPCEERKQTKRWQIMANGRMLAQAMEEIAIGPRAMGAS